MYSKNWENITIYNSLKLPKEIEVKTLIVSIIKEITWQKSCIHNIKVLDLKKKSNILQNMLSKQDATTVAYILFTM